ncbi:hypothetical protein VTL71DRAFT_4141 [Oculimacula yallundae]|uniref:RNB domain-containing protein n=1 Tax=Oculimacula yallundae TaxID=86028 RepID=A0ABR4C659_9HELO
MLRSFQTRKQVSQPFVCFHCLARYHRNSSSNTSQTTQPGSRSSRSRALNNGEPREVRRQFHAGLVARSSLENQTATSLPQEPPPRAPPRPNIRERLRQWEVDNAATIAASASTKALDPLVDRGLPGEVNNDVLHLNYDDFSEETARQDDMAHESTGLDFDRFDMVDVGEARGFLLPGDLVEISSSGNLRRELAIYVREVIGQRAQFYTMSGRWMSRGMDRLTFFVPGFVDAQELDGIIPFIPDGTVDSSMEGKLQSFNESVPVDAGQPLLRKMATFLTEANSTYQSAAMDLDSAHKSVADAVHYKYCTLEEIASKVLPKSIRKNGSGKYDWPALYAVHRAITTNEIGFVPLPLTAMRANPYYEVNGYSEVECISRVVRWVRRYNDSLLGKGKSSRVSSSEHFEFTDFVKSARRLIDLSRANRQFTPYGTIGPSSITLEPGQDFRSGISRETFTPNDLYFVRFLESWSCLASFSPHSPLHGIGSAILRQIDRYADQTLNSPTAYTCLQELGALPPWSIRAHFDLRLPHAGRQKAIDHRMYPRLDSEGGIVHDKFHAMRKDWGEMSVYCVDDAGAHEIDDGFSLEATDEPNVYWVHVHVADPAAHLDPRSSISQFAERATETIYLPDRVVPMLSMEYTMKHFSLAPQRRCLTFSTKTNLQGDMLDSKITAGFIRNVKYLTNTTLREVTLTSRHAEYDTYVVGNHESKPEVTRPLLTSDRLSSEDVSDLRTLKTIGDARRKLLAERGGIGGGNLLPLISMSFAGHPWTKPKNFIDSLQFLGDPTISARIERAGPAQTSTDNFDTVADIMIMTGEMAAKWCNERNIPVPYRLTPRHPDKQDPSEYFQEVVRPAQEKGPVPIEIMREYFALIGKVQPSSTGGPHVALGVDMFMKVTSPLRRYGDLLAHWQIEAALLREAELGHSLVGSSDVSYLPFSRAEIDGKLPRMASRERLISTNSRIAERMAYLQLILRAWKFGEAKLPSPLVYTVRSINPDRNILGGSVDSLLIGGQMFVPDDLDVADLEIGDKFEVEIFDLNVHQNGLFFKSVRKLESESELAAKKEEPVAL